MFEMVIFLMKFQENNKKNKLNKKPVGSWELPACFGLLLAVME